MIKEANKEVEEETLHIGVLSNGTKPDGKTKAYWTTGVHTDEDICTDVLKSMSGRDKFVLKFKIPIEIKSL